MPNPENEVSRESAMLLEGLINRKATEFDLNAFVEHEYFGKDLEYVASSLRSLRDSWLLKRSWYPKFFHAFAKVIRRFIEHRSDQEKLFWSDAYWEIRSIENQAFLFARAPKNPKVGAYAPGGSYGAFYLWYLSKKESDGEFPDVLLGSSAGAFYPTLHCLWRMAKRENPEITSRDFSTELSLIPGDVKNESMFWNGKMLIDSFAQTAERLIFIVNQSRETGNKLPSIGDLRFSDLTDPIWAVASRKRSDGTFQEVLFSGNDPVLRSITASSNPHFSIGPFSLSVLSKTEFDKNEWYDGWETNPVPDEYAEPYDVSKIEGVSLYPSGDFARYRSDGELQVSNIHPWWGLEWRTKMWGIVSQWTGFNREQAEYWIEAGKSVPRTFPELVTAMRKITGSTLGNSEKGKFGELMASYFLKSFLADTLGDRKNRFAEIGEADFAYLYHVSSEFLTTETGEEIRSRINQEILNDPRVFSWEWHARAYTRGYVELAKELPLLGQNEDDILWGMAERKAKILLRAFLLAGKDLNSKDLIPSWVPDTPESQSYAKYLKNLHEKSLHGEILSMNNNTDSKEAISHLERFSRALESGTIEEIGLTYMDSMISAYIRENGFPQYANFVRNFFERNYDDLFLGWSKERSPDFGKIYVLLKLFWLAWWTTWSKTLNIGQLPPLERLEFATLGNFVFGTLRWKEFLRFHEGKSDWWATDSFTKDFEDRVNEMLSYGKQLWVIPKE